MTRDKKQAAKMLSMLACQEQWWDGLWTINGFTVRQRDIAARAVLASQQGNVDAPDGFREGYAAAEAYLRSRS